MATRTRTPSRRRSESEASFIARTVRGAGRSVMVRALIVAGVALFQARRRTQRKPLPARLADGVRSVTATPPSSADAARTVLATAGTTIATTAVRQVAVAEVQEHVVKPIRERAVRLGAALVIAVGAWTAILTTFVVLITE